MNNTSKRGDEPRADDTGETWILREKRTNRHDRKEFVDRKLRVEVKRLQFV